MVLVHDYEIKIKGVKRKVIYHLSDLHLATYDELSSKEEIELAKKQTEGWAKTRRDFAESFLEPYQENEQFSASEHFEALIKKATEDGDCLVFAGDIFDYINDSQIRFFEKRIEKIKIPYIFAAGNHEETEKINDNSPLAKIKAPIQVLTIDDITIIALDNSKRVITREQIKEIEAYLQKDKKLIITMHTPIILENSREHKLCGEYFRLNHQGCPPENLEFLELLRNNDEKIIAVFAGHIHCLSKSPLTERLVEYTSSQGILGNINRYVIGE